MEVCLRQGDRVYLRRGRDDGDQLCLGGARGRRRRVPPLFPPAWPVTLQVGVPGLPGLVIRRGARDAPPQVPHEGDAERERFLRRVAPCQAEPRRRHLAHERPVAVVAQRHERPHLRERGEAAVLIAA